MFRMIDEAKELTSVRQDRRNDYHGEIAVQTEHGWESASLKRVSDDPKDKGLYVATSYEKFFAPDFESECNGSK